MKKTKQFTCFLLAVLILFSSILPAEAVPIGNFSLPKTNNRFFTNNIFNRFSLPNNDFQAFWGKPDSENTQSENSISDNSLSDNSVSDNSVSENSVSNNSISENSVSENSVSDNSLSENSVSENTTEEDMLEYEPDYSFIPANADEETEYYSVTFNYNGGIDDKGRSSYQVSVPKSTKLKEICPDFVTNGYTLSKWIDTATEKEYSAYNSSLSIKSDIIFEATYSSKLVDFNIHFILNGGEFQHYNFKITYRLTDTVELPPVERKGYHFDGWYKDSRFTQKITTIPKGSFGDIDVYSKWTSAKPTQTPTIKSTRNPTKGKATVSFSKMSGIAGYELLMSTASNFKSKTNTINLKKSAASASITNLPKGKTYHFKLRSYNIDSTGSRAYSEYSSVKKQKINKGVKEYAAKSNSASLKSCKVTKDGKNLYVKAKVSKRLKSADDSYYLVKVNPKTNKYSKKVAKVPKTTTVTFKLPLRKDDGTDLTQGKYAIAIKQKKGYKVISSAKFIANPETAATYKAKFPKTKSKKGLQGSFDADIGIEHTFINMDLNEVLINGKTPYKYNGKTYYFNDAFGGLISQANKLGLTITGQVMLTWNPKTSYMIVKSGRKGGAAPYYAINAEDKRARETLEAACSFMAERYSTPSCHLDNWVLGNEVNIHRAWYYAGKVSTKKLTQVYANAYRVLYYAVKSHSKNARVYICTDHTWTNRHGDWGAKPFMLAFNKEIKKQNKKIQWNLAYHAYPTILTRAATWNDPYAPNSTNAEFVTPKNLTVLTKFVKKNFGKKTRIILSEQGFTASSGHNVQAAGIAYLYYKAHFNSMIDSVIYRSIADHDVERKQGLYFGIYQREAETVFRYMDTKQAEKYTKKYLKTIGVSSWKKVVSNYNVKKLK